MTSPRAGMALPAFFRSARGNRAWWVALISLCVVLAAPLLVVDVPPLLDYPNHLARVFVLASLPQDPVLAQFYSANWSVIPNLAFDLIALPLIQLLPVHIVGRLLIATAVLLPVLGIVAYSSAIGGRWWSLGAGLVAYNSCLLAGFLNFEISLGVALLLAAAWLRWREPFAVLAIALASVGAPILFACHLMGLVFFGALIGAAELGQFYREGHNRLWGAALRRGCVLLLVFLVPVMLYAASRLQRLGGDAEFLPLGEKLLQVVNIFAGYYWPADAVTFAVVVAVPGISLLLRWGRVPGPAGIASIALLIAFLAAPYAWKSTYQLDTRFAVMLACMLFAGFVPAHWPAVFRRFAVAALLLLFIVRMALLTAAWVAHRADLADLRTVLAPVQPGQAVYVAEAGLQEAPSYWAANPRWRLLSNGWRLDEHLGALALIEHRAYWPFEFDVPSQQPIQTREPYATLAGRVGHLPDRAEASNAVVCGFDYVLLIGADAVPELPIDRFRLLVRSGFAALYAVTRCNAGVSEGPPGLPAVARKE